MTQVVVVGTHQNHESIALAAGDELVLVTHGARASLCLLTSGATAQVEVSNSDDKPFVLPAAFPNAPAANWLPAPNVGTNGTVTGQAAIGLTGIPVNMVRVTAVSPLVVEKFVGLGY